MVKAQVAIVGVGATAQGEIPGQSSNEIAARAAALALLDAGVAKDRVDGLITCKPNRASSGTDEQMAPLLGMNPRYSSTLEYGACGFSLHFASMAIMAGFADTVLLTFGTNQRSQRVDYGAPVQGADQWPEYAGLAHIAGPAAMAMRRHMHVYGTTEEQLGWVSVSQREWALSNPLAIFREPMSIADYLQASYVAEPLRRPDLTMISDGGAAVVMTRADKVSEFRSKPVYLLGMAQQSAMRGEDNPDRLMRPWMSDIAAAVYKQAGITAADIDAAYMQEATSVWILQMLEAYGFCSAGESGPFVADGHIRPGGDLPVNSHGGQLSESYTWNWLHLYEAVRQVRGECGARQLDQADIVLHAQAHDFWKGAATILSTHNKT